MTSVLTNQVELNRRSHIVDNLIELRTKFSLSNREIAEYLGVNENYISRLLNKRAAGSVQIARALMFLEYRFKYPPIDWPEGGHAKTASRMAQACGLSRTQFMVECTMRYGAKTMEDIVTEGIEKTVLKYREAINLNHVSGGAPLEEKIAEMLADAALPAVSGEHSSDDSKKKKTQRRSSK